MAHFAELDNNNIVKRVIVVDDNDCLNENGEHEEEVGIAFCKNLLGQDTNWKQTSYNTKANIHVNGGVPFRKNYAGIGYSYDDELDAFIPPQPGFRGWVLNETTGQWEAPTPKPAFGMHIWSNETVSWVAID